MLGKQRVWSVGLAVVLLAGCGYNISTRVRLLKPAQVGVQYRAGGKVVKVLPPGTANTPAREILRARKEGGAVLRALVERRAGALTLRCDSGCGSRPLMNGNGQVISAGPASSHFTTLGKGTVPPLKTLIWLPQISLGERLVRESGAPLSRGSGAVEVELTTTWDNVAEVVEMRSHLPWGILAPGLGSFFVGLGVGLGGGIGGNKAMMGVGLGILTVGGALIYWALSTTNKRKVVYRKDERRAGR